MSNDRPSELLGQLPRTRPHRRSTKRPARAVQETGPAKPTATATPRTKAAKPTPATKSTKPAATKSAKPATGARATKAAQKPTKAAEKPAKRAAPAAAKRLSQPAQPRGVPAAGRPRRPSPAGETSPRSDATPILRTALQAAGEIAEIGLVLSGRALRRAIERLPRA